ncbi:hypothetical protein [Foetidibacter luteolus]|uniref:hypothetical protein n=1 Tax=Foetidibacter luteolus TaxID=2608880 RepID=UPI00129B4CE7|nr:hypothetical protein [Foetidibacter luteolus]
MNAAVLLLSFLFLVTNCGISIKHRCVTHLYFLFFMATFKRVLNYPLYSSVTEQAISKSATASKTLAGRRSAKRGTGVAARRFYCSF